MTEQVDPDEEIEVSSDGVRVQKSFEADEFPVPAIRFLIESDRDEATSIRLAERIPEDFPMDGVGFHPDYESDKWTAYEDHHVEYSRHLGPDETVETVYGIRVGAPEEAQPFLTDPDVRVESVEGSEGESDDPIEADDEALADTMIEDIASESDSQAVKDMIAEDGPIPGLDDESETEADDDGGLDLDLGTSEADESDDGPDVDFGAKSLPDDEATDDAGGIDLDVGGETDATGEADDAETDEEGGIDLDLGEQTTTEADEPDREEPVQEEPDEEEPVESDTPDVDLDMEEPEATDADVESESDGEPEPDAGDESAEADEAVAAGDGGAGGTASITEAGSVAEQFAEELRSGEVSEEDKDAITEALDLEPEPSSVETARIEHLQSRVEDIAAYAEALEEFLDEEGTAQELIEDFRSDVEELREEVQELDDEVGALDEAVQDLDADVDTVRSGLDETDEQVEELDDDLSTVETRADDLRTDVDAVDDEVGSVASDLASLEDDLGDVEVDLEDVEADVEAIEDWRSQLGEMFTGD
jgi:predicted  nucleic acid-binding Zn-ribbon protein